MKGRTEEEATGELKQTEKEDHGEKELWHSVQGRGVRQQQRILNKWRNGVQVCGEQSGGRNTGA